MKYWLVNELVKPLLRRGGTFLGGYLTSLGVAGDDVTLIVAGLTAALTVAVDLLMSHLNRRKGN